MILSIILESLIPKDIPARLLIFKLCCCHCMVFWLFQVSNPSIIFFTKDQEAALDQGRREHFEREIDRLNQRIMELEEQVASLLTTNTHLKQELAATSSNVQQLTFQHQALQAQCQLTPTTGDDAADYDRLQEQFRKVLEEKNQLQEEVNQDQHSLQQREARCQQLAMQVSADSCHVNISV